MKNLLTILLLLVLQISFGQHHIAFVDAKAKADKLANAGNLPNHSSAFKIVEGMIMVQASLDNQIGNYIVDTGAPLLIINDKEKRGYKATVRSITQSFEIKEVRLQEFEWLGIEKKNISALAIDISHLEMASGEEIAGIIGFEFLKDYELVIDYPKQFLELIPLKSRNRASEKPIASIPFSMQAHLPIIKAQIGKKKMRLALDTGSEVNVLDTDLRDKISADCIKWSFKEEIQGVDKEIQVVEAVRINRTNIKKLPFDDMKYVFTDLSHLKKSSHLFIDGFLGYPFFKNGKFSINYRDRKIHIWRLEDHTLNRMKK